MSKKRSKKQQSRDRRKAKRASRDDSTVVPLFPPSTTESSSLIPAGFEEWVSTELFSADEVSVDGFMEQLEILLEAVAGVHPEFDATAWTMDDVEAMGSFLEFMIEKESIPVDQARVIAYSGMMLTTFLTERGRWAGDPGVPAFAQERLPAAVGLMMGTTETGPVDEDVERAALLATEPLARITVLLDWLGDGRPTTPNRWLKPAAARELAQALDLEMPPGRSSMSNFGPLRHLWLYAQAMGLIKVNTVRATPVRTAAEWQAAPVQALRTALTIWIDGMFPEDIDNEFSAQFYQSLTAVVMAGCTNFANTRADIDGWVEKLGYSDVLVSALHSRLALFIDEGWLALESDTYVVPEALRPAVLPAIPQLGEMRETNDDAPFTDAPIEGELYVRIVLDGVSPPVWRLLAVHSFTTLTEFHDILQTVFDWENSHLHQFSAGGRRWMDERALTGDGRGEVHSEHDVMIGDILRAPGAQMTYEYDFGDGWSHLITVADINPAPDESHPEVLDGEGMAPLEDVGGPFGWDDFVAAVSDPRHPDHAERREWAGLAPGQSFDPTAFDLAAVNRQLRRLF
ncbi:MAG: plasmid pRiA4b ORF-3 family protein [Actinomycetota bacterium]|nr:plasmid pRiA4b ORF-3 family protein [Actinomycetota bacterium]